MKKYTVRGKWPFPLDMLRYDQSEAATSKDQKLITSYSEMTLPSIEMFRKEGIVYIDLVGPNEPNARRWESFGWMVIDPDDDRKPVPLRKTHASVVFDSVVQGDDILDSCVSKDLVYSIIKVGDEYFKISVEYVPEEYVEVNFPEVMR